MSLILDALKRSEAERRAGTAGDANATGIGARRASSRFLPLALALLVTGLGIFAAWRGGLLLRGPDREAAGPVAASPAAPPPIPAPRAPAGRDALAETEPAQDSPTPRADEPEDSPRLDPAADEPAAQPQRTVASSPPRAPVLVEPSGPSPAPEHPAPAPASGPTPADYPPLASLDVANLRRDLMAMTVNMHVYADEPAERFLLIDLERREEGDPLLPGVKLVEITAEGSVVEIRGGRYFWQHR